MLSCFQLSGAMRPVFISLFLFSSIMAKDNSQISVQQRFVPGAVKLSINSGNALVLLSHSSDSGSIKIKIEKIHLSKRYLHIVREIPIIKSVSIEHISDMNGLITISLDRASEYDYDLKIKNGVLDIVLSGEIIKFISAEYYIIAEKHRRMGNYAAALGEYRTAIRLRDGDYPESYFGIGLIRESTGQFKLAIGSFKKTLSEDKLKKDAHLHLADLFANIGKPELQNLHLAYSNGDSSVLQKSDTTVEVTSAESTSDSTERSESDNIESGISNPWKTTRIILLIFALLSPFLILIALRWRAKIKSQVKEVDKKFEEELEEQINSANTQVIEKSETTSEADEPQDEEIPVNDEIVDSEESAHLKYSASNGKKYNQELIENVKTHSEGGHSPKEIAQELSISESEVNMILRMKSDSVENISEHSSSISKLVNSPLSSRELARELHRDEEELRLELLADEQLND